MSTEHTPGPWSVDTCGQPIIINGPDDSGNIIALVYDKDPEHHYHEEVAAANARLIAAAPDLLAALEGLLEGLTPSQAPSRQAVARAALARVKGEGADG